MKTLKEFPDKFINQTLNISGRRKYLVPVTFFAILVATMFMVEVGIMGLIFVLPEMPVFLTIFLDGFLLTLILFPVLFLLYLRPMVDQIKLQQQSEKRFRAVFEQTFQFMCILNPDGTVVQANQSAILAGNMFQDEIVGKLFWEAFHKLIPSETNSSLKKAIESAAQGNLTRFEGDFGVWEGASFTVDVSLKPIIDENGQVMMLILEGRDVTRHKRIEQALRAEIEKRQEKEARIKQDAQRAIVTSEILNSLREVSEDFQGFLETVVQKTIGLLGDGGMIHLLSKNKSQLEPTACYHIAPELNEVLSKIVMNVSQPIDEGLEGQVVISKTLLFLPTIDLTHIRPELFSKYHAYFDEFGLTSLMVLPLHIQGQLVGTLTLFRDQSLTPYSTEDLDFAQNIALKAAMAVHNTRLYQAEKRSRQTAETLGTAALTLTQTLKLEYIFEKLLDYLDMLVALDTACITLREDEEHLIVRAMRGANIWTESAQSLNLSLQKEANLLIEMPLLTQRSLFIPDVKNLPEWNISPSPVRSGLSVPIVAGNKVIGLCLLAKQAENGFTPEQIQWAEAMVNQAAVAIQNAWLFEQVRTGHERLQSLSHRLVEIQENERRYIARELHDEAGQALSSLMVGLRLVERDAYQPEAVLTGTAQLKRMVDEVLENLHRLAVHLRPASLDHLGLLSALQQYIEDLSTRHQLLIQFETMGIDIRLRGELETVLYRIVQEALTNVLKHAKATRVDVLLERRGDKLITIIEDNGVGFDPSASLKGDHLGLFGIRERLEMFGGRLHLESTLGIGTTLFVEVPYET